MRVARVGTVLGLALALVAGATAAHALWRVEASVPVSSTATGDLTVTATWLSAPTWRDLYPGQTTAGATLLVTAASPGSVTLRWGARLTASMAAEFAPYVTVAAWAGACDTGVPVPAAGYAPTGGLVPGATLPVCVRLTLAPGAPASLSGKPLGLRLDATVFQIGS